VPACTVLTPDTIDGFYWLPHSCAYRRLSERRPLADWHRCAPPPPEIAGPARSGRDGDVSPSPARCRQAPAPPRRDRPAASTTPPHCPGRGRRQSVPQSRC
jgi:hypothetical protein